jgi:hypothetical protein
LKNSISVAVGIGPSWRILPKGDGWCAIGPDFEDFIESGWGDTLVEARDALASKYRPMGRTLRVPPLNDFRVIE